MGQPAFFTKVLILMKLDSYKKTRPDTRPSVADGWAGAEIRVFPLFNSSVTDQPTDRRTDKASYRVACPQLKSVSQTFVIRKFVSLFGAGFGVKLPPFGDLGRFDHFVISSVDTCNEEETPKINQTSMTQ